MEFSFSLYAKNRLLQRGNPWIFPLQITVAEKGEERREMPPGGREYESRPGYHLFVYAGFLGEKGFRRRFVLWAVFVFIF
jgi:hypothetical protein